MITFAELDFALDRRLADGSSQRTHFERVEQRGEYVPDLHREPDPPELAYLVEWFRELASGRRSEGIAGEAPLSWPDIDAWLRLTGRRCTPLELRVIKLLDTLYLRVTHGPDADRHHR